VISSVQQLIGAGEVAQTDSQNLTLRNFALSMRLVGGSLPLEYLMYHGIRLFQLSWGIQAENNGSWLSLPPVSNSFTLLGTNSTGTFVSRNIQVAYGNSSGTLKAIYVATPQGPLKWDIGFSAGLQSKYRLVFSWSNITSTSSLSVASKKLSVGFGLTSYTLDWSDVPSSLNTTLTTVPGQFKLVIDLGTVNGGSTAWVDPTIATNVDSHATANSFQRHVFYDGTGGNYWVFYNNGSGISYRYSSNGINWFSSYSLPGWLAWQDEEASTTTVLNSGRTVVVAAGQESFNNQSSPWTGTVAVNYAIGTISGKVISWQPIQTLPVQDTCNNGGACAMLLDIWYVSLAMSSDARLTFSFDLIDVKM